MTRQATNLDAQRVIFVESLYNSLKQQAAKALVDHNKFIAIASAYLDDGLEESECVELIMLDGISREGAEGYVAMAMNNNEDSHSELPEYSFQFEDSYGKIWSSYDISRTVRATSDEEAWEKAEVVVDTEPDFEIQKVVSVTRIS